MIFTIFAILIAVEIIISYKCLTVTDYKIKSDKIKETTKIVLISDLHNSQFGSKNKRLVDKIQKQDPDLILMDGDMLNEDGKNAQTAVELISALKKTAPVYYALGNHEIAYRQRRDKNLYQKLQKAGAKVVEKEYEDASSQLKEKTEKIDKLEKNVEQLKQQVQTAQQNTEQTKVQAEPQPDTAQEGMISPSSGESAFTDTQLTVGEFISADEIVNIDKYFTFSPIERGGEIFNRINGKSYRDNNDISLESLRYLTIPYYNFDHQIQLGEMIVNVDIQNDVINIFKELFNNEYEIGSSF